MGKIKIIIKYKKKGLKWSTADKASVKSFKKLSEYAMMTSINKMV